MLTCLKLLLLFIHSFNPIYSIYSRFNILTSKKESISNIAVSNEYQIFRSNISLKQIIVDDDSSKIWKIYDSGPRNVSSPLICLPPVSGTADIFFRQMLYLNDKGYRVIAAEYPTYWSLNEFIYGFIKLLDYLHLDSVHLFGASLGGFLAQKFSESTILSQRVQSLFLCNSFADTSIFNHTESAMMFVYYYEVLMNFLKSIHSNFLGSGSCHFKCLKS